MENITKAQRGRLAIRMFKITADALALRGYYKPSGRSGQTLEESLKSLSPEIYGTMNDLRIIELKGLEYVMDRLPRGIEECNRIILTAEEQLEHTAFEKIVPLKRRRVSYRISANEMNFIITQGMSEIYDILTHLTFLNIESHKIKNQIHDENGKITAEWSVLESHVSGGELRGPELDRALWNLSIILGRTFQETRDTFQYLEASRKDKNGNNGLFRIIYSLGKRALADDEDRDSMLMIYFTPSLRDMIGRHKFGRAWADNVKNRLIELGLGERPVHVISANMHSVVNALYAHGALGDSFKGEDNDLYEFIARIRDSQESVKSFAGEHGMHELPDHTGFAIDAQIIDMAKFNGIPVHPEIQITNGISPEEKPVIIVIDYAFGAQAYEVMDELLSPHITNGDDHYFDFRSISIMGKAGILPGQKGDIMLPTAHVFEGNPHSYMVDNDLNPQDFDGSIPVYMGPIVTVLGTSLQNRDVLEKFQKSSWKAIGLEMEGGHYQRAVNAAIIREHIRREVRVRYAYYASDNPIVSGQTLASGALGDEGIKPTYMITKVILEKILN
ncbi:MAG TPA: hypothetical protein PK358_10720 [Spirochaetota bacterium]|nr:hypothetical protein [Spirochaetota bacterium]HPJ35299.1 hypothetical protein [Spirochaetota bacterium]